jgi:hypothetical protein
VRSARRTRSRGCLLMSTAHARETFLAFADL